MFEGHCGYVKSAGDPQVMYLYTCIIIPCSQLSLADFYYVLYIENYIRLKAHITAGEMRWRDKGNCG